MADVIFTMFPRKVKTGMNGNDILFMQEAKA